MSVRRYFLVASVVLLQACGGGGSGGPSVSSQPEFSSSSIASSAATSSSASSKSSTPSSMPADYPVGTVETLPILNLTTDGAAPILSREVYVNGGLAIVENGGTTVQGTLEVRGRGNSTWDWPKKPYRLKLTTSTSLLGMPAGKNWVLLANYADKTLMRNDVAFMFGRTLGMEYTPRAQYVELNLNGVYQGVYQLTEHIRIDKDRVNVPELKVGDTGADKITGGYLMEVDFRHHKDYCNTSSFDPACVNGVNTRRDVDYCLDSKYGMNPACLSNPETLHDAAWSAQRDYIEKYYADFEAALFGANFTDPTVGYAAYVDVDSVINYYLANEVLKNVDGAVSSFFLYKKRGGKMFFGPIWDFDLSMGNAGYDGVGVSFGWHIRRAAWFERFFQDPAFVAKVKARWKALKDEGKIEYLAQYAEARAVWLDKQQQKNYGVWSITDFASWIMHVPKGSYTAEVNAMVSWQRERNAWIDSQLQ